LTLFRVVIDALQLPFVGVCSDLMQNPLIVPVKILRCHSSSEQNDVGVLDCEFHPTQPWIVTCGADNTLKLFT